MHYLCRHGFYKLIPTRTPNQFAKRISNQPTRARLVGHEPVVLAPAVPEGDRAPIRVSVKIRVSTRYKFSHVTTPESKDVLLGV